MVHDQDSGYHTHAGGHAEYGGETYQSVMAQAFPGLPEGQVEIEEVCGRGVQGLYTQRQQLFVYGLHAGYLPVLLVYTLDNPFLQKADAVRPGRVLGIVGYH